MNSERETRVEIKAVLKSTDLYKLELWIFSQTNLYSLFPARINNNLYYETDTYSSACDNIDGISKRTKVRYRWYGHDDRSIRAGKLEFKRKLNNEGWKEAYKITLDQNFETLKHKEIMSRISSALPLNPKVEFSGYTTPYILNRYERKYYSTADDKIRVTVDCGIVSYDQRWSEQINRRIKIKIPDLIVVEFKFDPLFKSESIKLIKDFPFRISKHSKYITAVLHST